MNSTVAFTFYRPTTEPKAVVEIVHGMQEHRKRYDAFAEYLSEHGYVVVTFDLPGHGESCQKNQPLGYFGDENGWDHLIDSTYRLTKEIKEEYPNIPFILMGHSMGTMVSRCYIQDYDHELDGLILSGAPTYNSGSKPGLALAKTIRSFKGKKGYSKTLDKAMTGGFNKCVENPRTELDWLSYDTDNVDRYIADELCGQPFTIQGYIDELEGMIRMNEPKFFSCKNPNLPIYFFGGADDPCIQGEEGLKKSIKVLQDAGYSDIEYKLYNHMRHETLNETEHEKVFEDVLNWLDKHVLL